MVVVGNGAVGKTSMIRRYCRGIYTDEYKKTIGQGGSHNTLLEVYVLNSQLHLKTLNSQLHLKRFTRAT